MTASEYAKKAGLVSLVQVCKLTSVKLSTLNNWYSNKPTLFKAVVLGAKQMQSESIGQLNDAEYKKAVDMLCNQFMSFDEIAEHFRISTEQLKKQIKSSN